MFQSYLLVSWVCVNTYHPWTTGLELRTIRFMKAPLIPFCFKLLVASWEALSDIVGVTLDIDKRMSLSSKMRKHSHSKLTSIISVWRIKELMNIFFPLGEGSANKFFPSGFRKTLGKIPSRAIVQFWNRSVLNPTLNLQGNRNMITNFMVDQPRIRGPTNSSRTEPIHFPRRIPSGRMASTKESAPFWSKIVRNDRITENFIRISTKDPVSSLITSTPNTDRRNVITSFNLRVIGGPVPWRRGIEGGDEPIFNPNP